MFFESLDFAGLDSQSAKLVPNTERARENTLAVNTKQSTREIGIKADITHVEGDSPYGTESKW